MGEWTSFIWIGFIVLAGLFQLVKRLIGQPEQKQRREPPRRANQTRSYRPPQQDMEELRAERGPEPMPTPVEEISEARAQRAEEPPRPRRALAGDPATEGHRISVELPPIPPATEGPAAQSLQVEGPPLPTGPEQIASSVQQRRVTIAAHHRPNRLRRHIRQSLASRQRIREAFVLQAIIGQPRGLLSDEQAVERP